MFERRLIIPQFDLSLSSPDDTFRLPESYAHYISRVLRMEIGAELELCDGRGGRWAVALVSLEEESLSLRLLKALPEREQPFPIYLAQAVPKGEKFERILRQSTELGVSGFLPFFSERCVVKLAPKRLAKRMLRWEKVVQEAVRQSERAYIPSIASPVSLKELVEHFPPDTKRIVCWAREQGQSFKSWVSKTESPKGIVVLIGPEGGFSEKELSLLKETGVEAVGLGLPILRTETAGPCMVSLLQYCYGYLGDSSLD